ncbi:MAG TPA: serine/threonine-protein kinase [Steroidobacteraceae bacterium]|nr:serine/threonine-protein kinase [Steroidobacteraceae bacterium]
MPIFAAQWKRLSPLLDAALDLAPAERAEWLAALPAEHADLREALTELLTGRGGMETDDFLKRLPEFSAVPVSIALGPDSIVGPYRLLRELGSGGTSSVWLAERADGSIQRKVALKLPHLGLVDRGIQQRIAREREILAGLEHPNIARLYDAGVDEHGRPYLALEYVDGATPDEYCRAERLGLRARLQLFLNILRAVAFAHARLIVHRDLKPNNILIAAGGEVRLLDFGIARLLQPENPGGAQHTMVGGAALTPAYAAPEQFSGQPVTVATDVYSLGVILFEMLTGASPYRPASQSLGAYEHEVMHVEPPLPSQVVRPAEAGALRGDLDAIVAKALEKRPGDRYASVEAFAADIERHLAAEPIAARPRSWSYVARKFMRRNALPLAAGLGVLLVLSVALGVAAWQWRDAERQRAMAVERLANSDAAATFTETVLMEGLQPGESMTFEQLVARSEQIARQTGRDDLRTRIFATEFLGNWYRANGFNRNAEALLTHTIDSLPPESTQLGATLRCARAELWGQLGRPQEALATLEHEVAADNPDDAIASRCLMARATLALSSGDGDGALEYSQAALQRFERAGVDSMYGRAEILKLIGAAHGLRDEFAAAHEKYRAALQLLAAGGRARGRAAANVHDEWSTVWMNEGNPRRALEETDIGWDIVREQSPNAQITDRRIYRRARILAQLGRFREAQSEFEQARRLAADRGNVLSSVGTLIGEAEVAIGEGRLEAASGLLDNALTSMQAARLPETHVLGTRYLIMRAAQFAAANRPAEAGSLLTRAIANYQSQHCCRAHVANALATRAELELRANDIDAAAADATQARDLAPEVSEESFSRFSGRAWYVSGLVHERRHDLRSARDAFATAAMQFAGAVGESHPDTLRARAAMSRAARRIARVRAG